MKTLFTVLLAVATMIALPACSKQEQEEARKQTQSTIEKATEATKDAAGDAADYARDVAERAGDYLSDSAITTRIKAALFKADQVSAGDINVETINGHVVLSGVVATDAEADLAEQLAEGIEGVKSVENDIEVRD